MKKGRFAGYVSIVLMSISLMLAGCARDVSTQSFTNTDLGSYKTYAWLPPGDSIGNSYAADENIASSVRDKINSEMQQKGYRLDASNPDLLLLVHTNYNKMLDVRTLPASYTYYGPGFYTGPWYDYYYPYYNRIGYVSGSTVEVVDYTEGTVVIDLIDTKKEEILWRGTASEPVYDDNDVMEEMVENIEEIFEEFPG